MPLRFDDQLITFVLFALRSAFIAVVLILLSTALVIFACDVKQAFDWIP